MLSKREAWDEIWREWRQTMQGMAFDYAANCGESCGSAHWNRLTTAIHQILQDTGCTGDELLEWAKERITYKWICQSGMIEALDI